MHQPLFAIFDRKVGSYLQPFCAPTEGAAIRYVQDLQHDQAHAFARFAEDYDLFYLGTFDNSVAIFDLLSPPRLVASLAGVLPKGV